MAVPLSASKDVGRYKDVVTVEAVVLPGSNLSTARDRLSHADDSAAD